MARCRMNEQYKDRREQTPKNGMAERIGRVAEWLGHIAERLTRRAEWLVL